MERGSELNREREGGRERGVTRDREVEGGTEPERMEYIWHSKKANKLERVRERA